MTLTEDHVHDLVTILGLFVLVILPLLVLVAVVCFYSWLEHQRDIQCWRHERIQKNDGDDDVEERP